MFARVTQRVSVVRARAPLRLGLAGGGTDLSPFCDDYGGAVLNFTIDRYAYAFVSPRTDEKLIFAAQDLGRKESFDHPASAAHGELALHRGVYFRMMSDYNAGRLMPLTVTTSVDAPMGSGLGSSSALVVALVDAYRHLLDLPLGPYEVARLAFEIERNDLGLSGGKQDQYSAAFGGANFIEFLADDRVIVNPLRVPNAVLNELESCMVAAFTGQSRSSAKVIDAQTSAIRAQTPSALSALHQLKFDAIEMKNHFLRGEIIGMATVLGRSWAAKKATASGVSNAQIDQLYELALRHGALAGKVSGAGGGGFMVFMVRPEDRHDLVATLNAAGATAGPVKFTQRGSETWHTTY